MGDSAFFYLLTFTVVVLATGVVVSRYPKIAFRFFFATVVLLALLVAVQGAWWMGLMELALGVAVTLIVERLAKHRHLLRPSESARFDFVRVIALFAALTFAIFLLLRLSEWAAEPGRDFVVPQFGGRSWEPLAFRILVMMGLLVLLCIGRYRWGGRRYRGAISSPPLRHRA